MQKFPPLSPKVNALLHGADYNPEQWENYPGIISQDQCRFQPGMAGSLRHCHYGLPNCAANTDSMASRLSQPSKLRPAGSLV